MIFQYGGQTYTVTPQPDGSFTAVIGDETIRFFAERQPNGGWLLAFADGQRVTGYAAAQGSERFVFVDGQHFILTAPDARTQRRRQSAGSGDLTAQMPGKVADVRVQAGDAVERGQTLVIIEAMKMEIRVSAPGDGRVKRVLVAAGDVIERGQLLIEFS